MTPERGRVFAHPGHERQLNSETVAQLRARGLAADGFDDAAAAAPAGLGGVAASHHGAGGTPRLLRSTPGLEL